MKPETPYVIFGTHALFGDYVDAIHASGGFLSRVVRNVEEPERPEGQRFEDRLALYENWLATQGMQRTVRVEWLSEYMPEPGERNLAGFRGVKLEPLIRDLKHRHGIHFDPLVHPTAYVSPMAVLEEGVFIGATSVIGPNTRIGRFSLINRKVSIGHDGEISDHVIVGPSVSVASRVKLCRGCVLGIASTVLENLTVGEESYVAAGAVVLKDVAEGRMVAGVPAVDKKASPRK